MNKRYFFVITAVTMVLIAAFVSCSKDNKDSNDSKDNKNNKDEPVPVISITTQPAASTDVMAGSILSSLTVEASVTEGAMLTYQWYNNTSNSNSGGTEISGATSASFTIPTTLTANSYHYFCEVRASGGATSVRSSVATVTVTTAAGETPVISITTQPAATTSTNFGSISESLTVAASVTESATLSYQWYGNTSNSNTDGTEISGATSASFAIPTTLMINTYYYFCEVSASGGAASVRSNVATVTVSAALPFCGGSGTSSDPTIKAKHFNK